MKYDVVNEDNLGELIQEVNKKLVEGWKPLGGIVVRDVEYEVTYYQTIVKPLQ